MNLDEFIKALQSFNTELEIELPNIMARLALDAKDMIEQRVTTTGLNANNDKFGDYVEGAYKNTREERGLETSFVDFRNTGRMWNSITVIGTKITAKLATATLGSNSPEEEDKLEWQYDRYNSEVLELTISEIAELETTFAAEVQLLLDKFLK